jgi:hypothetical protein
MPRNAAQVASYGANVIKRHFVMKKSLSTGTPPTLPKNSVVSFDPSRSPESRHFDHTPDARRVVPDEAAGGR